MRTLLQDVRFGLRMLARSPGFTAVAVLSLALGIGANTALFSVINAILLNPVPARDPERFVQIRGLDQKKASATTGVSPPVLQELRTQMNLFEKLAMVERHDLDLKGKDFVETVYGCRVSPNFFSFWEVAPLLGRTFANDEDTPGQDGVMVLSYAFWQSQFAGDPACVGQSLSFGERSYTVIGVMPADFQFPWTDRSFWIPGADPVVYRTADQRDMQHWIRNYGVVAQLREGVSLRQVQAMAEGLAQREARENPRESQGWTIQVRPVRQMFTGDDFQHTLLALSGAIAFVLLIVCANVANLTLARMEQRQQEWAIRGALGASRLRIARQVLTESLLIAGLGGLLGLVIAIRGIHLFEILIPPMLPHLKAVRIDGYVLGFTALVSLGTALVCGLAPAWQGTRSESSETLRQAAAGLTSSRQRRVFRGSLIVIEVAMAMVLLSGAGLMIRSVVRLLHVDPGYDADRLLYVYVFPPWKRYQDSQSNSQLLAQIHERIAAIPGVDSAGLVVGETSGQWVPEGQVEPRELSQAGCGIEASDPFHALGVPLRAGRLLHQNDVTANAGAVVINETLARTCWPGQNPLGKHLRGRTNRVFEVVGVVGDIRAWRYDQEVAPTFYRPYQEWGAIGPPKYVVVRTRTDPEEIIKPVLSQMKVVEPELHRPTVEIVRQELYEGTQARRTYVVFLGVFAAVGLVLAAVGIAGVLAFSVTRRTRELGIRMALGAQRADTLKLVMGEGLLLTALGLGLGCVATLALTPMLRHQLFGVSPADPVTLVAVGALLGLVALLACYIPARRATKVDPMVALRCE